MKNLENVVGLQEMSLQEMEKTNGGLLPLAMIVGIWAVQSTICAGLLSVYATVKSK